MKYVVHLPPYHCELNPIELAWSQVKRYIKENNQLFTLTAVKELTYRGIDQVGPANWKKLVEHIERAFKDKYWCDDGLQKECIDKFIISVGGSDDETSSESSSESSDESHVLLLLVICTFTCKFIYDIHLLTF